jgi:hypothetical protein
VVALCKCTIHYGSANSNQRGTFFVPQADIDHDGFLDADEFAVAMYLCQEAQKGSPIPTQLSPEMIPPSKM